MNTLTKTVRAYVPLALRTELNPKKFRGNALVERRLLHAAIGVGTEVAELVGGEDVVNELEELGDLAFYLAIVTDLLFKKGKRIIVNEPVVYYRYGTKRSSVDYLIRLSGELLDYTKRQVFYRKEPDWNAVSRTVKELWQAVFRAILLHDGKIQIVLDANIEKLKARYPKKFSCRQAVQRDVLKERKVLEDKLSKAE